MTVYEKGVITIVVCAGVFALLAIPLMLRMVPRNVVYGYRTRATLADDVVWYEANAYFGRALLMASIFSALTIFILYRGEYLSPRAFLNVSVVVLVAPSAIAGLATSRRVRSLTAGRKESVG